MSTVKLFHFDIATRGNYGDNLLFPMVRETFQAAEHGELFEFVGHAPLRDEPSKRLIEMINAEADAVVLGGGGLFLRGTNENSVSGWQWRISPARLASIKVPIIVYAVGYNRFIGQEDFIPKFSQHLRQTVDQSVFVGLRNSGSIRRTAVYLPDTYKEKIQYQPCPTTITGELFPTIAQPPARGRVIALQAVIGKRQVRAGFSKSEFDSRSVDLARALKAEGWSIVSTPFAAADEGCARRFEEIPGLVDERIKLYGAGSRLFDGLRAFSKIPIIFGTRGHAQMVPFGTGAAPLSFYVHDKLKYFAEDIGFPDWVMDYRSEGFVDTAVARLESIYEDFDAIQGRLLDRRAEMRVISESNLKTIHNNLSGGSSDVRLIPGDARTASVAEFAFDDAVASARLSDRIGALESDLTRTRDSLAIEKENRPRLEVREERIVDGAELGREKLREQAEPRAAPLGTLVRRIARQLSDIRDQKRTS